MAPKVDTMSEIIDNGQRILQELKASPHMSLGYSSPDRISMGAWRLTSLLHHTACPNFQLMETITVARDLVAYKKCEAAGKPLQTPPPLSPLLYLVDTYFIHNVV